MFDVKDILKTADDAVANAQQESLKKGVPNVYSRNGRLYFELSDGTLTQDIPEVYREVYREVYEQAMAAKAKYSIR